MEDNSSIWIEIKPVSQMQRRQANLTQVKLPKTGYVALFAGQILLKPFEELVAMKWGFSQEALLKEAWDRQKLFVEAHHYADERGFVEPPDGRTLALRIIHDPSSPNLQIILLGKIYAGTGEAAYTNALDYWHEISSLFPYDYALRPISDQTEFSAISMFCTFNTDRSSTGTCIEITRFEGILQSEKTFLDVIGLWNSTLASNEKIWRILASSPSEIILNITMRPTILFDDEFNAFAQIAESAMIVAHDSTNPLIRQDAELIHQLYLERSKNTGHTYLAQLHLVSPTVISDYIPRAIGSALTHHKSEHSKELGYQMRRPQNKNELSDWLSAIYWLEFYPTPGLLRDVRLQRLRYLANSAEASALFQLPYPPKGGIFGVSFEKQSDQS